MIFDADAGQAAQQLKIGQLARLRQFFYGREIKDTDPALYGMPRPAFLLTIVIDRRFPLARS